MTEPEDDKLIREAAVTQAFTPSAPLNKASLFQGRFEQIGDCIQAFFQKGQHIALYGERGVGKTSMARVLPEILHRTNTPTVDGLIVDCNTQDDFSSIWRKVFRELERPLEPADETHGIEPEDIRFALQRIPGSWLIVLDELDRVEDDDALSLLADTLKTLSDHAVGVTVMVVGVAESVEGLVGEHESIVRSLAQVRMPRMSGDELRSILTSGYAKANLSAEDEAADRIIRFAEGFPHFVHFLAQQAGIAAVQDDRAKVTEADLGRALARALDTHSMVSEYQKATSSNQPGSLLERVLLACAFAPRDDRGYFRAADLKIPLTSIVGRPMDFPNFNHHLGDLASDLRGGALQREGKPKSYRYRFTNPLLQPYAKIRALARGLVTDELWDSLQDAQEAADAPNLFDRSTESGPHEQQSLSDGGETAS
jgi:Cdc6-like AAA superfamily ATPase